MTENIESQGSVDDLARKLASMRFSSCPFQWDGPNLLTRSEVIDSTSEAPTDARFMGFRRLGSLHAKLSLGFALQAHHPSTPVLTTGGQTTNEECTNGTVDASIL